MTTVFLTIVFVCVGGWGARCVFNERDRDDGCIFGVRKMGFCSGEITAINNKRTRGKKRERDVSLSTYHWMLCQKCTHSWKNLCGFYNWFVSRSRETVSRTWTSCL